MKTQTGNLEYNYKDKTTCQIITDEWYVLLNPPKPEPSLHRPDACKCKQCITTYRNIKNRKRYVWDNISEWREIEDEEY
jgi:hypothetical protein